MAESDLQARQRLLDVLGEATDELADALAALGGAYEQLDEHQADQLEEQLFRPLQLAYGRAKRTYEDFARRYALARGELKTASAGLPSTGVKGFVDQAVTAAGRAEAELIALQESPMAIEVGDPELRAGISEVRRMIDGFSQRARNFVRTFGR